MTVVLLYVVFSAAALKIRGKYFIFTALAVLVFFAGYFRYYEWRVTRVEAADKASINSAIKLIPADKNTAVVTNTNIAPHLCCRKYIFAMELSTPEEIFTYLHKGGLPDFYLFLYLKDFTYEGFLPMERSKRIMTLAQKMGYTGEMQYDDKITVLIRFWKR
jgi:hypothetical protein